MSDLPFYGEGGSVCVAKAPIQSRMAYLRKVYSIIAIQQFSVALASFALFMTPGVRPFVQFYSSTTWLTTMTLIISIFCLRRTANRAPHLLSAAIFFFTIVLDIALGAFTALFETEAVHVTCVMTSGVLLCFALYCCQTTFSLKFLPILYV
ncbi:hypothetical protein Q1695_001788 [Nippostrongylus brasiliensis]|nr:hypothetical protein Q1695_001788 [Nippostrongylus brasiliensis]